MSKIRTIKPEFWTSEDVVKCDLAARLFFIGLWSFCDDAGVFKWSPLSLKMLIFPNDQVDTVALLAELEAAGLIRKFDREDQSYGIIVSFAKHQKIDQRYFRAILPEFKPKPEEPPPPDEAPPNPAATPPENGEPPSDHAGQHVDPRGPDTGGGEEVEGVRETSTEPEKKKQKKPSSTTKGPRPSVELVMKTMTDLCQRLDGSEKKNRQYAWLLVQKVMKAKGQGEEEAAEACKKLIIAAKRHEWWSSRITKVEDVYRNAEKIGNAVREAAKGQSSVRSV